MLATKRFRQTKSLFRGLDRFTITREGKLLHHRQYHEPVFDHPLNESTTPLKCVPRQEGDVDLGYHGDIEMCETTPSGELVKYVARFTDGILESIRPLEALSEIH